MRSFFKFWRGCAPAAAKGSAAFANDWQWLFGIPVLAAVLWLFRKWLGEGTVNFLSSNTVLRALAAALIVFVITWIVGFSIRLLNVPVELDRQKTETILELEKVDRGDLTHARGHVFR
jgi:hypothetical protein